MRAAAGLGSMDMSFFGFANRCRRAALLAGAVLALSNATLAEESPSVYSAVAVPPAQIDAAIGKLDGMAAEIMAKTGIPGMAVAVVRGGATVYAKGFGVRKVGEAAPVDADTVFQIASVSKSLAATVVARQVGRGVVAWDTPIVEHLPWFALNDPWVTRHVTIADLFAHRSGLPDHAGDILEDLGYDRRAVLERLRLLPLESFRASYAYTNFGLTAAAEAVATASGTDWAQLSEEALYAPLGMASTSSRFADFVARPNRAYGHVKIDGRYEAKYQRQPDAQSPAGGVSSSVNDLARWMALVLADGTRDGAPLVDGKALLAAARIEVVADPSGAMAARPGFYGYGMGVGVGATGRMAISHSGAFALGAGTTYLMIPSLDIGIVVLTNASPLGAAEAVALGFSDVVQIGHPTRDWLALLTPVFAQMMAPTGELQGKSPPADPAPAAAAQTYAGTYANAYYGDAKVSAEDGRLTLTLGPKGVSFALKHWDGDRFVFYPTSENANPGTVSLATFDTKSTPPRLTVEYLDTDGLGTFTRR